MDDLTAKILAAEADWQRNPQDWQYTRRCYSCGREIIKDCHKSEIEKYRQQHPGHTGPVVIEDLCEKCAGSDDDEEG